MEELFNPTIQAELLKSLNPSGDESPDSPTDSDSPPREESNQDFEDIPLFRFGIPLPPGLPPSNAIYTSQTDDLSLDMELSHLQPTSIILVSPDTHRICKDYQQGMCRNADCKCAHEVDTAELQRIFFRCLNENA